MELFISWSGKRSQAVAEALREWLVLIFPESKVRPWMSTKDLGSGEWRNELERHLSETHAGIICVTPENLYPSWMLYEVGFLSSTVKGTFVVPYLIDIDINELKGPLEQFQGKRAGKEGTRNLVSIINKALGEERLDSGDLDKRFEALWRHLDERIHAIRPREIAFDVKNDRGITLRDAIERVGLTDIENRQEDLKYVLPPEVFYRKAAREIVITGPSAYRTFSSLMLANILRVALQQGKRVYVLILHPNAADVKRLRAIEYPSIRGEIKAVISHIKDYGLHTHPDFQIKFMQKMPPFQGVMIDGDVSAPEGGRPNDQDGQIRVQPRLQYSSTHEGVVLQFKKTRWNVNGPREDAPASANFTATESCGFDYFAQDLRRQWRLHGMEYPALFQDTPIRR